MASFQGPGGQVGSTAIVDRMGHPGLISLVECESFLETGLGLILRSCHDIEDP